MNNKLIIFGTGSAAELAYYYFKNDSPYDVIGFCVDSKFIKGPSFMNLPLYSFEKILNEFSNEEISFFIAIGYSEMNTIREKKYKEIKSKNFKIASYISSKASVLNSQNIGENCFILEDNTIQPYVEIKNNVTLWSGNHIGHHSIIEDNVFISSHVVVSGNCSIGRNSFLGVNSVINNGLSVGRKCLISSGAIVEKTIKDFEIVVSAKSTISKITTEQIKF